ncbi:MAG: 50S ribosomal protein L29 [Candidatus Falkowbacteria bacterium]
MEIKELITKTKPELTKLLVESQEKLRELRFKDSNKQLKNIRSIRVLKQDIARINTLLNKKD